MSRYDVIILDIIIVRHYRNYVVKQRQRKTMVRNDKKEREKGEGRIKRKGKKGKIYTTDDGTILTNRWHIVSSLSSRQLRISLTKKSATGRGICEGRNRGKLQRVRSKIKVVLPRVVLFNEQSSNNCTRRRALYAKMYVITDENTQCIEFMRCGNFNFSVYIYGKEIKITIR